MDIDAVTICAMSFNGQITRWVSLSGTAVIAGITGLIGIAIGLLVMHRRYRRTLQQNSATVLEYADRYDNLRNQMIKGEVAYALELSGEPPRIPPGA